VFLCTTKYDAKHLQARKDKKLQNKQIYKIAKQVNKDKTVKSTRVYVYLQNNL
jgi:hypothetical protein